MVAPLNIVNFMAVSNYHRVYIYISIVHHLSIFLSIHQSMYLLYMQGGAIVSQLGWYKMVQIQHCFWQISRTMKETKACGAPSVRSTVQVNLGESQSMIIVVDINTILCTITITCIQHVYIYNVV